MSTRNNKRKAEEETTFDEGSEEPIAKRVADAAMAPEPDPARPTTFEDLAHWNRMFFELMVSIDSSSTRMGSPYQREGHDPSVCTLCNSGGDTPPSLFFFSQHQPLFFLVSHIILQLYRANYGNVNVKSTDEKYQDLYRWIVQLRKDYKVRERNPEESTLTADQIKTLESVRFAFTTRGEEHWQKNYEKLQEYKKEHGHVMVPRQCEIPGLGDWVSKYHVVRGMQRSWLFVGSCSSILIVPLLCSLFVRL